MTIKTVVIPFSGFYESMHDAELDWTVENILQDDSGTVICDRLHERVNGLINWGSVHVDYARHYCEAFADQIGIALTFESLQCPREYNFTTDRIFANIETSEAERVHGLVDTELLAKIAADMFTSRSGFHSFYNPDVSTWGTVDNWDHNQLAALIHAFAEQEACGSTFDELGVMEYARCNGQIEDMLWHNMKDADRIGRVLDYMRERRER